MREGIKPVGFNIIAFVVVRGNILYTRKIKSYYYYYYIPYIYVHVEQFSTHNILVW